MRALYLSGRSMAEIGRLHGLTRQRVHQILTREEPSLPDQWREVRIRERLFAQFRARAKGATPCRSCGSWVLRLPRAATCSPECARRWDHARFQLDEEARRKRALRHARYALRHPDRVPPPVLNWARGFMVHGRLSRGWTLPDSMASTMAASIKRERLDPSDGPVEA